MELSIHLECPQCNTLLSQPIRELSIGRRQNCEHCNSPVRLTPNSLDLFTRDLRCYCEG
jgi:hypothetical protein